MTQGEKELLAHAATGSTTMCRAWAVTRQDGAVLGFTDHDTDLAFDGITFRADTGLTASAIQQATGLSVDNLEALGALTDDSISEAEIEAGRYDRATVVIWQVNWARPDERMVRFRGSIGEIRRSGPAFQAELRGLTEDLNKPLGRVFQKPCIAVLGDSTCRFDTASEGYFTQLAVVTVDDNRVFEWPDMTGFEPGWFVGGKLTVTDGKAAGLWAVIKSDTVSDGVRSVELWEPIRAAVQPVDTVRLIAGCDKRMETCRLKFNNIINFQVFPDLPNEDWVAAVPRSSNPNTGGSMR